MNVAVVSGVVRVREKGTNRFHLLFGTQSIPVGSSVDTTKGKVQLASAKKGGGSQSMVFFDGRFNVQQSRRTGLTNLKLQGGSFQSCRGAARSARVASRVVRRLWGQGKGKTRTSGHNGSGTVRGTYWLTEDRCDGTLFKVRQGVVVVRDFARHRTVILHAGQQYLARARYILPHRTAMRSVAPPRTRARTSRPRTSSPGTRAGRRPSSGGRR